MAEVVLRDSKDFSRRLEMIVDLLRFCPYRPVGAASATKMEIPQPEIERLMSVAVPKHPETYEKCDQNVTKSEQDTNICITCII